MGVFSIERRASTARDASPGAADARPGGWPQSVGEFERFVDAYLERLVQYAAQRLGNSHDAEDVVQEVFLRAFEDRARFHDVVSAGPYLYRMTANACTDVLRKRQRSVHIAPLYEVEGAAVAAPHDNPAVTIQNKESASRAEGLLERLPKKQAEAIRMRVFGGLSLEEIAAATLCSANTVSSRLRYGFGKLRRIVRRECKT